MGIPTERNEVTVQGELDLRGTLGIARDVAVGFETIQLHFDVAAPTDVGWLRKNANADCAFLKSNRNDLEASQSARRVQLLLDGGYDFSLLRRKYLEIRKQRLLARN